MSATAGLFPESGYLLDATGHKLWRRRGSSSQQQKNSALYQGTTLVVPQVQQNQWALVFA